MSHSHAPTLVFCAAGEEYSDPRSTESLDGSLPEYWGAKARLLDGSVELLMAPTVFVNYC